MRTVTIQWVVPIQGILVHIYPKFGVMKFDPGVGSKKRTNIFNSAGSAARAVHHMIASCVFLELNNGRDYYEAVRCLGYASLGNSPIIADRPGRTFLEKQKIIVERIVQ